MSSEYKAYFAFAEEKLTELADLKFLSECDYKEEAKYKLNTALFESRPNCINNNVQKRCLKIDEKYFTRFPGFTERVRKELKAIEQSAGRRPEDKKEEKVSLDIDLLSFDDRVLKPEDLKREYVVKGLEELKYNQI
jgi:hypothetical protein